jgi:hypothetical protein
MIGALYVPAGVDRVDVIAWAETDDRAGVELHVHVSYLELASDGADPSVHVRGHVEACA